ncbi:MAG: outer membrane beta-barrel protein, partial [Bacteroidota bacterium]
MKFSRFIFLLVLPIASVFPSEKLYSQRILGAVSVGMNLTQVDGDEYFKFQKFGLNFGPMVILPFGVKRNWSVSMELLYSQKGSYHRGQTDTTTYRLKLDYAEIPVLFHFTDKKIISAGVGFSYGQLINFKETLGGKAIDTSYFAQPTTGISNFDISVIADLQIRLWSKLWAGARYQYSMKSNRSVMVTDPNDPKNPFSRNQYNNVITVRLTWVFNQPKIE